MRDFDTRVERTRSVGDVEAPRTYGEAALARFDHAAMRQRIALKDAAHLASYMRASADVLGWTRADHEDAERLTRQWRTDAGHAAAALLSWLLLLALLSLAPTVAAAQSDVDRLMMTAWSECGASCAPHEIAALHQVIAGIAEREDVRWSTAWRLASPRLAAGTVSRAWLAGITERCEEPEGWPRVDFVEADGSIRRAPRWSRWRARCLTLAGNVRAVMSGEVASQCAAPPRVWGDARDRARGEARGRARFIEVDCGETALVFGEWEAL